jgi:AGZA family xanthine/uracil permease-like MFS transporter
MRKAVFMEKFFKFEERGTTLGTELIAGLATFMTMAYIVFVNPGILVAAGVPFAGAVTATALGAALMCVCMGAFTNRPFALASGMGLNAVVAFTVIGAAQSNVPWQVGMAVIFVEGIIILILVLTGLRTAVMNAIPTDLKRAIGVGIGIFIALIGLNEGGIIRPEAITLVKLGDFSQPYVWVTLIGLFAILAFMALKIKGDILWGILVATAAALLLGVTKLPAAFVAAPDFSTFFAPFQTVTQMGADKTTVVFSGLAIVKVFLAPSLLLMVFAIMLTDFFDTMGTVVAVGEQAGFVGADGKVPGIKGILTVDSIAASVGGLFGASSITTYIESAAGVAEGGRTGLTAIVTGVLFAIAAFFTPVIEMIGGGFKVAVGDQYGSLFGTVIGANAYAPNSNVTPDQFGAVLTGLQKNFEAGMPTAMHTVFPITAGALIIVGFLMMRTVREIPWTKLEEAFPAFLVIIGIPLTYNISYGIGMGFISYVIIKLLHRKAKDIHPLMYFISAAFAVTFVLPVIQGLIK